MDLGSVKSRLEDGFYNRVSEFVTDVLLVFANAKQFNPKQDLIFQYAQELEDEFLTRLGLLCLDQEGDKICASCNQGELELDPQLAVLTCSVCECAIKPNVDYYRIGNDRGQHWCGICYDKLPNEFYGVLGQRVPKRLLEQLNNTRHVELERWMQCQKCLTWWHSSCALGETTICPTCSPPLFTASSLPRCAMATYIEQQVQAHAITELTTRARSPGHAVLQPQLCMEDAKQIAKTLICRILSSFEFSSSVVEEGARIKRWIEYQAKASNRSAEWAFSPTKRREKCIGVFQHQILCFVLYVYEYSNCVYISYLDSCAFIQPRRLRSVTYQSVMAAYFCWIQERYQRVYLWASPPNEGDAYVFNARPFWQRNPTPERLKRWYAQLFKTCRKQGILKSESTLYEAHLAGFKPFVRTRRNVFVPTLAKPAFALDQFPLFSGDYCQAALEIILCKLERSNTEEEEPLETRTRLWWMQVWGECAVIETVVDASTAQVSYLIKPNVLDDDLPQDASELDCSTGCSFHDRDEWLMRKLADVIRIQKDSFLVYTLQHQQLPAKRPKVSVVDDLLPANIFTHRLNMLDYLHANKLQFSNRRRARHSTAILLEKLR
ncbi:hypothetical protein BASA81_012423 [Batrachochytrium salamandrivorans]|nr:hypothetical protein BASA81_012423 [Batrachochytrium salamandrivorans]